LWKGILVVWTAANLGAFFAFLAGRFLLRSWVSKRVQDYPKFAAVDEAISQEGWKIVLLVRLSPVIPFNLLNYALAITDVTFFPF
jgi:uncharacterized membrane protein YdjX (TVP38/TMEM64 family)